MSYHHNLGSMFDAAYQQFDQQMEKACPPGSSYVAMMARADELERTWNPTGYYTWSDMAAVIDATVRMSAQASSAAQTFFAGDSTPSAKDAVRAAMNAYFAVAKQANDYTLAWKAARDQGRPVAAPGFKRWVVDDLRAAAKLFRAIEVAACTAPWWVGAAASYGRFFNGVIDVAKRIAGIVEKLASNALKAAESTGDIISFLLKWGPYLALGVGGMYAYRKIKKAMP